MPSSFEHDATRLVDRACPGPGQRLRPWQTMRELRLRELHSSCFLLQAELGLFDSGLNEAMMRRTRVALDLKANSFNDVNCGFAAPRRWIVERRKAGHSGPRLLLHQTTRPASSFSLVLPGPWAQHLPRG